MPLIKTCNIAAYRRNIASEIDAGKDPEQAAAIAAATLEAACNAEGKEVPVFKSKPTEALARIQKNVNPRDFALAYQFIENLEMILFGLEMDMYPPEVEFDEAPIEASFMFVGDMPSEENKTQGMTPDEFEIFQKHYLEPVGVELSTVAVEYLRKGEGEEPNVDRFSEIQKKNPDLVLIALGNKAKESLTGIAKGNLPHPAGLQRRTPVNDIEVVRKMRTLSKNVDKKNQMGDIPINPSHGGGLAESSGPISIIKAALEKRIVYGVVLDPYIVDRQGDWMPPADVESTAHGFMLSSRTIGFEHMVESDSAVVESSIVEYPTPEDYKKAMAGLDHSAFIRPYGDDEVRSGTWILGVKLGEQEWGMYKDGRLTGFSVGGFGRREDMELSEMPKVNFIEQGTLDNA